MKYIVITGASRGVGAMLARGLAKKGHYILGMARNSARLADLIQEIHSQGGRASFEVVDMMNTQQVMAVGKKILKDVPHIDVWINNVGVNKHHAMGPTWGVEPEHWWTEVSLNLYTAFIGTHTAINLMKARNYGYVINLGGGGVQEPKPFGSAYGAAKTALVKFTETVNIELEREGLDIKAFAFNPGFIRNARTEKLVESEVARRYMPKLEQIFKHGEMSDIRDSIDLIESLISGKADRLGGKYFFSDDKNITEAIAQQEEYVTDQKNVLRVRGKKP